MCRELRNQCHILSYHDIEDKFIRNSSIRKSSPTENNNHQTNIVQTKPVICPPTSIIPTCNIQTQEEVSSPKLEKTTAQNLPTFHCRHRRKKMVQLKMIP